MVSSETIDIYENRDLAEKYGAMSVPKTFINENLTASGLEPEENFIASLIKGDQATVLPPVTELQEKYDIIILGGGPAGLTSAIYAERSGLRSLVLEQANVGGQIAITPVVENYTGFPQIAGKTLVDLMAQQAASYAPILQGTGVMEIKFADGMFKVTTPKGIYSARGIIIATGATHKELDAPGEKQFAGRGVSYCATCDGYLFKDGMDVIVVGGGNSALTDALYLDSIGASVTVVIRGDRFKGEKRLQDSLVQRNIKVIHDSVLDKIIGDQAVRQVRVKNINTNATDLLKADGVFIAIGYVPNVEVAKKLGLELDRDGYIKTDPGMRTSMKHVYAAGDVTGGVKQISVAVGQGSIAAISAFDELGA